MESNPGKNSPIISTARSNTRLAQCDKAGFDCFCSAIYKHLVANRLVRVIVLPVLLLMVISNWAELKIPEYAKNLYECFESRDRMLFSRTMLGVLIFTLGHYTIAWLYCCIFHMGLYSIKSMLLYQCTEEYLGIQYEDYRQLGTGRILAHVTRQTDAAARFLTILVKDVGYDVIFFVFCMASVYRKFGISFFLIFSVAFFVVAVLVGFASLVLFRRKSVFNRHENAAFNRMVDIITNFMIIRSYNKEQREIGMYANSMGPYVNSGRAYEFSLQTFFYFFRIIAFFMYFTIIHACFADRLAPGMKGADFLLLHGIYSLYKKRIMTLMKIHFELIECYADLSSSAPPSPETRIDGTTVCLVGNDPTIEFDSVVLLQNGRVLIDSFNMKILPGQKIAVTGRNGSGKSTLIKALIGFGAYEGDILVDGVQISSINEKALHDMVAYVPQEPHLMNTTVIANLCYGAENVSEEDVVKVCKACGVHELFSGLSAGYRTPVGENSSNLSGGQAQLINFMRAVIKDAPVIVLDEPTSNLDIATSEELLSLVFGYLRDKTVIFSTHNPHHLARFDKIININNQRANIYQGYEELASACCALLLILLGGGIKLAGLVKLLKFFRTSMEEVVGEIVRALAETDAEVRSNVVYQIQQDCSEKKAELKALLEQGDPGKPHTVVAVDFVHKPAKLGRKQRSMRNRLGAGFGEGSLAETGTLSRDAEPEQGRPSISVYNTPIYIYGRYIKRSRSMTQSPLVINGSRKTPHSVSDFITEFQRFFDSSPVKFMACGREDVDVRCTGGRPFILEIPRPRRNLNSNKMDIALHEDVDVLDCRVVDRDMKSVINSDESSKTYSAIIFSPDRISFETTYNLQQRTPLRVLHRRANLTREREIQVLASREYARPDGYYYSVDIRTSSGTYVKEWASGDFGRTVPNLNADLLALDVTGIGKQVDQSLVISDFRLHVVRRYA